MPSFRLTQRARQDLREVAEYTEATWGKAQRNRYMTALDTALHRLAERPLTGRQCDFVRPGYRRQPAGEHVIYYRHDGGSDIEIMAFLHKRQDPLTNL